MKKRIAVLLVLACLIGAAMLPVHAAESTYYEVGYAKVDINPYDYSTSDPNDLVAIPMAGNGFSERRLSEPSKIDDNGDGVVDEKDGLFATCVAITDSQGSTLLIISLDIISSSPLIVNPVRQRIVANHPEIDADRIMINSSHTHSGPDFSNAWKGGYDFSEDYIAYVERVISQVTLAADQALADRTPATMYKGTIEANDADCAQEPVGDTLNEIRAANVAAGKAENVTVLTKQEHPELFGSRVYNGVRHYLVNTRPAEREITRNRNQSNNITLSDGTSMGRYAYYTYPKDANGDYIGSTTETGTYHVGGDNFNGVKNVGEHWTTSQNFVDGNGNIVTEEYYKENAGTATYNKRWTLSGYVYTWKSGGAFWKADVSIVDSVDHVSETDDTVQVLEFRFDEQYNKKPIILVNFRAHNTMNRSVSLDYRANDKLAALGDFTSYYQMSGDWVQALRSALEFRGYRAAYLQGAAGNVNGGSRIKAESAWKNWAPLATDANGDPIKGTGAGYNGDGYLVADTTHAMNAGNIFGSELSEVVIECLENNMVQINKDGGLIRSVQTKYQTERQQVSTFEYMAALDYRAHYNPASPLGLRKYTGQFYYEDADGNLLIDTSNGKSKVDENGVATTDASGNTYVDSAGDPVVGVTKYVSAGTVYITSVHHANSAASKYASNGKKSAALELNAIMIGKEYAMVTAPNELFDRYSTTADQYDMTDNLWSIVDDYTEGSYGEPFILGYSNDSKSYLPSKATYSFSSDNENYATGSYETLTSAYAAGNGEAVVQQFDIMLDFLQNEEATTPTTKEGYCSCCDKNVVFTQLTEDTSDLEIPNIRSGHYYLDSDITLDNKQTMIGAKVCLDLNGHTLTTSHGFTVTAGSALNLMGEGTVAGIEAPENGGVFSIQEGGALNLYKATVKYTGEATREGPIQNGGILHVEGTFNMYGGKVEGTTIYWTGGAAYVSATGRMNLYGGEITEASTGKDAYAGDCINNRGTVLLSGDAKVKSIYFMPNPSEGGPVVGESLIVKDNYSGSAILVFQGKTVTGEGFQVGLSDNAKIANATLKVSGYATYSIADKGGKLIMTTAPGTCTHCGTPVVWEPLNADTLYVKTLTTGHYYVETDASYLTQTNKTIPAGNSVCLDLRGKTYDCTYRAFDLETGATLNILGTGKVSGRGTKANATTGKYESGGVIRIAKGATVNLYEATLKFTENETKGAYNGGILAINGTFNMYGGTITDGKCDWAGGNVYISTTGAMNMYGGSITGGTAAQVGDCVVNKGILTLKNGATIEKVYQMPTESHALGDMLVISGVYTGSIDLGFSTVADGDDIGNLVDNADLSAATITASSKAGSTVRRVGTDLVLKGARPASVLTETGTLEEYASLQAAIDAYGDTDQAVVLQDGVKENVATDKAVILDLNGCTITGNVTGSGTVTVMDSQTDDYNVEDGFGYGMITGEAANVVPAENYVKITEDNGTSFHKIDLTIKSMGLRPAEAGLYFKSDFAGDQIVAEHVDSFGVALSVAGEPDESTLENPLHFTRYEKEAFGTGADNTSTLLTGVLKEDNGYNTNVRNSKIQVYGRAYIEIDGEYTFGVCRNRSMVEQLEGIDAKWSELKENQIPGIQAMYNTYKQVMRTWNLPNLKASLS